MASVNNHFSLINVHEHFIDTRTKLVIYSESSRSAVPSAPPPPPMYQGGGGGGGAIEADSSETGNSSDSQRLVY